MKKKDPMVELAELTNELTKQLLRFIFKPNRLTIEIYKEKNKVKMLLECCCLKPEHIESVKYECKQYGLLFDIKRIDSDSDTDVDYSTREDGKFITTNYFRVYGTLKLAKDK